MCNIVGERSPQQCKPVMQTLPPFREKRGGERGWKENKAKK